MDRLNTVRRHPRSGETKSIAFLLHGLGDSGAGLIGLSDVFGEVLPDTLFIAPDAPFSFPHVSFGYQWFEFPSQSASMTDTWCDQNMQSTRLLLSLIADEISAASLGASSTAVFGFSQGAMIALSAVPRMLNPVACLIGCSGGFLSDESVNRIALSKPPVLLVHGNDDDVVPVKVFHETESHLKDAGFEVRSHLMSGVRHEIPPAAIDVILKFMKQRLGAGG